VILMGVSCCLGNNRFAHFFVHPLLNPSSVDREIEAVDSGK